MKSPLHDEQQQQQQSLEIDRKVRAGTKCDQIQEQSVQFLLAASGLCLPDSPWYMYLLALAGLMGPGTCYWYMLTQEESKADSITSHGDVKWQIDDIFDILQQLAPWGFLLYLTRSDLHTEFEDIGHSLDARDMLKPLLKAALKEDPEAVAKAKEAAAKAAEAGGGSGMVIVAILVVLAAIAYTQFA